MKAPLICSICRGWFEDADACPSCDFQCREVKLSWTYWLTSLVIQVHSLLRSTFRERRGVVKLLGVPPAIGFALLNYFARPQPALNRKIIYSSGGHASYKQGTSKGGAYHFIKFAYDCMAQINWAFPLHDYFPKTAMNSTRLVTRGRFSDLRLWGTPCQFKYVWAVQKKLGALVTTGTHVFSVSANITHIGHADGLPRWNTEYGRWVVEQQVEHIVAVKNAIIAFPARPFRANHKLAGVVHRLAVWANQPTVLPATVGSATPIAPEDAGDDGSAVDGCVDAVAWVEDTEDVEDADISEEEFSELSDHESDDCS